MFSFPNSPHCLIHISFFLYHSPRSSSKAFSQILTKKKLINWRFIQTNYNSLTKSSLILQNVLHIQLKFYLAVQFRGRFWNLRRTVLYHTASRSGRRLQFSNSGHVMFGRTKISYSTGSFHILRGHFPTKTPVTNCRCLSNVAWLFIFRNLQLYGGFSCRDLSDCSRFLQFLRVWRKII